MTDCIGKDGIEPFIELVYSGRCPRSAKRWLREKARRLFLAESGEAAPGRRLTASAISAAETIEFRVNFIFMRYQLVTWSMEAPFENFVS